MRVTGMAVHDHQSFARFPRPLCGPCPEDRIHFQAIAELDVVLTRGDRCPVAEQKLPNRPSSHDSSKTNCGPFKIRRGEQVRAHSLPLVGTHTKSGCHRHLTSWSRWRQKATYFCSDPVVASHAWRC